ncbi:MAG: U3 snoRNP protein [Trizodia sp. TS-e1964]|nr:MAG: U3 snoRNP protein [Trizodia sp. TS-e1964]
MSTFKVSKATQHSRNHRFRSFNQRIASIKIDPIRRSYKQTEALSTNESYFQRSLEEWKDLNLSECFTEFSGLITPISESLPQVLHYQNRIVELLVNFIGRQDRLALEPILSLTAHLAHDLGIRFERHLPHVLHAVVKLASKHTDVDVVEWSFNCLAWLFKYLSRLLISDLRPVYKLMAPLLGKERQKPYVTRFAAEALSFLVRRAGVAHQRNPEPLESLMRHIRSDLSSLEAKGNNQETQYQQGVMALIAESVKGVGRGINSSGGAILVCMLQKWTEVSIKGTRDKTDFLAEPPPSSGEIPKVLAMASLSNTTEYVICGVFINLVHHTELATFSPIMDSVMQFTNLATESKRLRLIALSARLLSIITGTRKGSRIENWNLLLIKLLALLNSLQLPNLFEEEEGDSLGDRDDAIISLTQVASPQSHPNECPLERSRGLIWQVFWMTAIIIHLSPMENLIPYIQPIMELTSAVKFTPMFLPFCLYLAKISPEKFSMIAIPYLQRFTIDHGVANLDELSYVLPKLASLGSFSFETKLTCPKDLQELIYQQFSSPNTSRSSDQPGLHRLLAYLNLLESCSSHSSILTNITKFLRQRLVDALKSPQVLSSDTLFAVGGGFRWYSKIQVRYSDKIDLSLLGLLSSATADNPHIKTIGDALIPNLASSSHDLRTHTLLILQAIFEIAHHKSSDLLSTALLIQNTPLDLQTARTISMHIRKMGLGSHLLSEHPPWLEKVTPYFCFGIMTIKLAPLWEDTVEVLKGLALDAKGEVAIVNLALDWLNIQSRNLILVEASPPMASHQPLTDFQCSNFSALENCAFESTYSVGAAVNKIEEIFKEECSLIPAHGSMARSQSLRVLQAIPRVAEKHSRTLVPIFLKWASDIDIDDTSDDLCQQIPSLDEIESDYEQQAETDLTSHPWAELPKGAWSRKDQKAMLALFALFINPKSLYRSADVYSGLTNLLANGDVDIQKSALNAILTWKNPSIVSYQEKLMNLLDDARFREELSEFVDFGSGGVIQQEHRKTLMPILLRLLYGRTLSSKKASSGKRGSESRRAAVLRSLSDADLSEFKEFVTIALGNLGALNLVEGGCLNNNIISRDFVSARKQIGFLKMAEDMIKIIKGKILPVVREILEAVLYCIINATRKLADDLNGEKSFIKVPYYSLVKTIRQSGTRSLNLLFANCPDFTWKPYMPIIFDEVINPRICHLPSETAHSVSGILQILSTWSNSEKTVLFLTEYNNFVLEHLSQCLENKTIKDKIILFVLTIIGNIIELAENKNSQLSKPDRETIIAKLLHPNTDAFMLRIGAIVRGSPSKDVLEAAIHTISHLAPFVMQSSQAHSLIDISVFLLNQPSRRVNPKIKSDLIRILLHFLPLYPLEDDPDLHTRIFESVTSLFNFFRDRTSRETLSQVLQVYALQNTQIAEAADLCADLNSFLPQSLDVPDFDRRLKAFTIISEHKYRNLTSLQWRPILQNMLYYIKDNEELAIRSSAAFCLRQFVEATRFCEISEITNLFKLIRNVVLPALRSGIHDSSELVRTECVNVVGCIAQNLPILPEVSDMSLLVVGGDEEASFFNNILHIQHHRRLKALRRLASEAGQGHLFSDNLAQFFIPLIEHYIWDSGEDAGAQNLASESITTIGLLSYWLEWPQFRAIFKRYSSYVQSKPSLRKRVIKLIGNMVDGLVRAIKTIRTKDETSAQETPKASEETDTNRETKTQVCLKTYNALTSTIPGEFKLSNQLSENLLPPLLSFVHDKDESTVSLRVPVAISIVKILKLLSPEKMEDQLPPVLTDICHILRSKDQEARDITRRTLADIAAILGPTCFGFIMKELRGALQRGYQLHVLSYTMHSLLVATTPTFKPGDLDYCLSSIVAVIMDDTFGTIGQEKDAEEYVSKMKEVKSSKSYDSMELAATTATLQHLYSLIRPIKNLLMEKLNLKTVKKIDELLRRVGVGLLRNEAVKSQEILVFCYEVFREMETTNTEIQQKPSQGAQRYLIQMKGARMNAARGSTSSYLYKLKRFSLDVLRVVLQKYNGLQTRSNLSNFLPIIGDALLPESQEEIIISAMRLLTTIIKVPLHEIDENGPTYIDLAVRCLKSSPSSKTELAQASLKLLSAIIRDRKSTEVKEKHVADLILRLKPDLEEPDRQGITFNFLKAVMARKIVIPELYEILDVVAKIMVTNQSRAARDLARGVYFQFLMEYPQAKHRFSKQTSFLIQNLDFPTHEGRKSVLEVIHLLVAKINDKELLQAILAKFFIPLVLVLANDEFQECREMAGTLIKELLSRSDSDHIKGFLSIMRGWISQEEKPLLTRLSLQCYEIYFEIYEIRGSAELDPILESLSNILQFSEAKNEGEEQWEVIHFALQLFAKLCLLFPVKAYSAELTPIWLNIRTCLFHSHAWVQISASKLIGLYLAEIFKSNKAGGFESLPLRSSHGLLLEEDEMLHLLWRSVSALRLSDINESLAAQTAKNLVALGKILAASGILWKAVPTNPSFRTENEDFGEEIESNVDLLPLEGKTGLTYLLERLSVIIRQEPSTPTAASLYGKTASLHILASLCSNLDADILKTSLSTLIFPLYVLTDLTIPPPYSTEEAFKTAHASLVSTGRRVMQLLQSKVGDTVYNAGYMVVRKEVLQRREARKTKRRIESVTDPEKSGKEKLRRGVRKKERRKERGADEREKRRGW